MARPSWNRNIHYHPVVLRAVPPDCKRALDVGCGAGLLAGKLAARCRDVIAIDIDAPALGRARAAHSSPNLTFLESDVMTHPFDSGSFDFVASIATLHHLPFEQALVRFQSLLRPGGVLAVIGLYDLQTISDFVYGCAAMPVSWWMQASRRHEPVNAPIRDPAESLSEIIAAAERLLPGAAITRQLLFRYSLIWRKPRGESDPVVRS